MFVWTDDLPATPVKGRREKEKLGNFNILNNNQETENDMAAAGMTSYRLQVTT